MQDLSTAPLYLPAQHIAEHRVSTCFVPYSHSIIADPTAHAYSKGFPTRDHYFRLPQPLFPRCLTTTPRSLPQRRSQAPCLSHVRPLTPSHSYILYTHFAQQASSINTSISNASLVARVKKIISQDDDISNCSNNAAFVITVATEMFLQHLVEQSHNVVKSERKPRRNIQYRDVGEFLLCLLPPAPLTDFQRTLLLASRTSSS